MNLVAGIDIGGTKTKIGLIDQYGKSHGKTFFRTREYPDIDDFLDEIIRSIGILKDKVSEHINLIGIGIGAPNASSKKGTIENAANLAWKGSVPLVEMLKSRLDVPIKIMNDASAAALGEMMFGGAKGMDDFIVVTLGTGLGGGIVANGQLIEGRDGFAGELGHIDIHLGDGRLTGLGVAGGIEAYVSATGLKRTILHMLCKYLDESRFRNIAFADLHGEEITKAAEEGDSIAIKAFEYTGEILGFALANFVAFSQPEAIFLLGGLARSGKWIFEPTRRHMEARLLSIYKGKVQLLESAMEEQNAGIAGAAALIWSEEK